MERLCGVESLSAVQRRFSDGLEVLKCMMDFFKEMADIERHYANAVTKLMNTAAFNFRLNVVVKWLGADTYVEVGTLKAAWDKMGSELLKLAEVHAEKAEQYTSNVRQPLMECVPQIDELKKKLRVKGQNLIYNVEEAKKRYTREKQRYLTMSDQCNEIEKKILFMKQAPAAPPPVISRQENRLESLKKELGTLETLYSDAQKEVDRINALVEQELINLYREAHEVELQRVNTVKGCLQTFTKSLSNTAPAYLESMRQLIVCVDEIDGTADINRFVESHPELLLMQDSQTSEQCKPPPTSPPQPPPTSPPQPPPTSPPQPSLTSSPQPPPTSSQAPSLTIEQPSSVPLATPPLLSSTFVASSKSLSCDSVKVKMSDVENPTANIGAQANSSGAQAHPKPPVASRPKSFSNRSHPRPVSSHPTQADGTGPTGGTGDEEPRQHGSVGGSSPVRDRKLNAKTVPTTRSPQANQSPRKGTAESPQQRQANRNSPDRPALRSRLLPVAIESKVSSANDVDGTNSAPNTDRSHDHLPQSADPRVKGPSTLPPSTNAPRSSDLKKNAGRDNHAHQGLTLPRPHKPPIAKKPELLHRSSSFPSLTLGSEAILERVQRLAAENDYYGLLELDPEATPEELAKARRDKSKSLHPDHFSHAPAERKQFAEKRLMLINQVYEDVLKTPDNRTLYDQLCRFRQHYHKVPHQSKNSLQQAEEKLEALQRKMKKARLPLGLQEEVSQALQLIRITLQKSEQ
eukprot:Em0192g14a